MAYDSPTEYPDTIALTPEELFSLRVSKTWFCLFELWNHRERFEWIVTSPTTGNSWHPETKAANIPRRERFSSPCV